MNARTSKQAPKTQKGHSELAKTPFLCLKIDAKQERESARSSPLTFAVWYVSYERWKHFNFGILISLRAETLVELVQQQAGHLVERIVVEVQLSG